MGLHEAGVTDTVVRGGNAYASLTLLHHDGQDKAAIDACSTLNVMNSVLNSLDFIWIVVGPPSVPSA